MKNLEIRQKKLKKFQIVGIEFSINDSTKSPQIKILSQFSNMSEICCIKGKLKS